MYSLSLVLDSLGISFLNISFSGILDLYFVFIRDLRLLNLNHIENIFQAISILLVVVTCFCITYGFYFLTFELPFLAMIMP